MKIRTLPLTLISSLAFCYPLFAAEGLTPLQPGATTGTHTGALPPDGIYMAMTSTYETGSYETAVVIRRKSPGEEISFLMSGW